MMGYVLLWIEDLAVSLLFVATVVACLAQLGLRQLRCCASGLLVLWLGIPAVVGLMAGYEIGMEAPLVSVALIGVAVICTVGGVWVLLRGPGLATAAGLIALVPLAVDAVCIFWTAPLYFQNMSSGLLFPALMMLTIAYGLGAAAVLVYGLRHAWESVLIRAATWPRGRLAVALLVAMALHLMTFWNLDLAARQQLAALRTEAGALALSVAPPRLPERDNAAIIYRQAFEAFGCNAAAPDPGQWEKQWQDAWSNKWVAWHETWQEPEKIGFDLRDPELRRFLKRQSATLALLRQAGAMPGCNFNRDYGHLNIGIDVFPSVMEVSRYAAYLLALDAIFRAEGKDYRVAVEDVNAMFRLAEHVRADPFVTSQLESLVVDVYAVDTLRRVLASGQAPPEDIAAIRLPEGTSYRTCLQLAFRMDRAFVLAAIDQLASGRYGQVTLGVSDVPVIPAWFYRMFLLGDDIASEECFAAWPDGAAGEPYDQAKETFRKYDKEFLSRPRGLVTALLLNSPNASLLEYAAVAEARCGTARLGVALYAYRARNGRFPEKLDDLVPDFIPAIPRDPFGSQPMKLKRTEHGLIAYSIGPDMIDNGGAPLDNAGKTGDITFTVQ